MRTFRNLRNDMPLFFDHHRPSARDATSSETASETLDRCLHQITSFNGRLNAVVAVAADARTEAARCDARAEDGESLGLLHGVPILVKDNVDVAGLPTTNGFSLHDGSSVADDATVVRRLRAAGAVIIGKANLDEFALGTTGTNSRFASCVNPWDERRIPGGSSGGSAVAVAAGMSVGAVGTDTGGSVRTPSALTGVCGLRPSMGAIPADGITPVSPFFDIAGPIARDVITVLKLYLAMAEESALNDRAGGGWNLERGFDGLTIGVPSAGSFNAADDEVQSRVNDAVALMVNKGARVVEVALPGGAETQSVMSRMMLADAFGFHRSQITETPEAFSQGVLRRISVGATVSGVDYSQALYWTRSWRSTVGSALSEVDFIAMPTVPQVAPLIDDCEDSVAATMRLTTFTYPWSLAGVPAMSIPCGLVGGLPVGLQLVSSRHREDLLFRAGIAYQRATEWHRLGPTIADGGAEPDGGTPPSSRPQTDAERK
jgi:aspartyl-tRNA(Asn)/glutamyl-tRNA(Gln) amidotransferase subunit A